MTDIANLTPEESFKAGLPIVLQLEAWITKNEEYAEAAARAGFPLSAGMSTLAAACFRRSLALVTAKDADRDLGQ